MNSAVSEPVAKPFRAGLFEPGSEGAPRLLASACRACGRSFFPARQQCPYCGEAGQMAETPVCGTGTIYASTVVHVPSPTGIKPPYAYGYVDLDDAPLRVFALFAICERGQLAPGTRVEMIIAPLRKDAEGNELMTYKFRPVEQEVRS